MIVYLSADPDVNRTRIRDIYDMLPEREEDVRRGRKNPKKEKNVTKHREE